MLDRNDASFAVQLERAIIKLLSGDEKTPGLYRAILSAQNWESVLMVKGQIQAYENVLKQMQEVALDMNDERHARNQADRSMN